LSRMAAACGLPTIPLAAQRFSSFCLHQAWRTHNLSLGQAIVA